MVDDGMQMRMNKNKLLCSGGIDIFTVCEMVKLSCSTACESNSRRGGSQRAAHVWIITTSGIKSEDSI